MTRILLAFSFIALVSTFAVSQVESEKEVSLSAKEIDKRIIKREFPNVPKEVRDCHGTGQFVLRVKVNKQGIVDNAKIVSGMCSKTYEYVEKTVSNWKFEPLLVNKTRVSFSGMILIPFCYGTFERCY